MDLTVNGRPRGTGVTHQIIREASHYYLGLLVEDIDIQSKICVRVNLVKGLSEAYEGVAFSGPNDQLNEDRLRPIHFIIELDSELSLTTSLIALAHEFVHVKQLVLSEKQLSLDGTTHRWMGGLIPVDHVHYYDLPWEIEAHGREYGLYDRFINRHQNMPLSPATISDIPNLSFVLKI